VSKTIKYVVATVLKNNKGKFLADTSCGYGVEMVLIVEDIGAYYEKVKDFANVYELL
jgi:hypothetical protein